MRFTRPWLLSGVVLLAGICNGQQTPTVAQTADSTAKPQAASEPVRRSNQDRTAIPRQRSPREGLPGQGEPPAPGDRPFGGGPRFFGPGGMPPFGPGGGGPGGPMQQERKLVPQFDKDGDKRLDKDERQAAREFIQKERGARQDGRRFGPRGFGGRENQEPAKPGPRVALTDVQSYPDLPLYEPTVLRTFFLEFENPDWEAELADFYGTDVDVPATLIVDGKKYPNVGLHFRGASSYFAVGSGFKRSLNLSIDHADSKQRLYGYKSLNLLNSHSDPTFLHTVLYFHIARHYLPAPKANHVKLVINGESWGIYVNAQQFNKEFTAEWFDKAKGARWKVPGSPGSDAGLAYVGDNLDDYKRRYELKAGGEKAWPDLITLCRTLSQTPPDQLEETLTPLLDIDRVLWFLALENVFINNDGYWIRSSDYNIFRDSNGQFHIIPHDANETFQTPMGPGFGRGPRVSGVELDPLTGSDNPNKPLLSRLLAVPSLKKRYLQHVRTIAEDWLDWNKLKPVAEQYYTLIEKEVEADTRKLSSFVAFKNGLAQQADDARPAGPRRDMSIQAFVEQRRNYLLNHPEIKQVVP